MSYIKPQYCKTYGEGGYIPASVRLHNGTAAMEQTLKNFLKKDYDESICFKDIRLISPVPQNIKDRVSKELSVEYVENKEGFVVDVQDEINIYSDSPNGLYYGLVALIQLAENQKVDRLLAYDYPLCPVRGVKVYLPSRDCMDYFKEFVDMVTFYKGNTIMIEVGGAMEYKNHPEINEGWVEYCKEMYEYSGKTTEIQEHTFKWRKNSIHAENGGGSYLTQEEVRELVEYCKERFMNVIPEVPCLSHCDYLLIRHPELAERQNDPYPDTYCPSNPDSYKLLFEVMEEIIDVFEPSIMNIGHDEYYSIGICDRCKGKKAEEIYADDITKIRDFLAGHGVKTMIWGDKLLNAYNKKGMPCGGAERPMYKNYDPNDEFWGIIPPTYKAIDLIPKDVEILHWYWSIDGKLEEEYFKRNLEVTYGNFRGSELIDRNNRLGKQVKGGIVSNWSTLKEENLQRNGILFNMLYNQIMFWDKNYKDSLYNETRELIFDELYWYKYRDLMQQGAENKNPGKPAYIEITHTTDNEFQYVEFVDGVYIDNEKYTIGHYVVEYVDGTRKEIPIIYGWNISSMEMDWGRKESERVDAYKYDNRLFEAAATSRPMNIDGNTWYRFIIANPCPDKTIKGIYVKNRNAGKNIYIKEIKLA